MTQGYRPRRFDQSPLFKVVFHHFEDFQETYHRRYSENYGYFRRIITHTVERFLDCGDPREGIARYECGKCGHSIAVPFSCKTRLFCPTCHEKKTLLWIEDVQSSILLPVPHRFWTFSIPKRLRLYFMYNRKLLSLMVDAANFALTAPLSGGRLVKNLRPGIVSLIQTHSDSLEFNPHLHMVVTDGLINYTDPVCPVFRPVKRWDGAIITEVFRWRLLKLLIRKHVITPEIANNMLSWPHSGFNVHATAPFDPSDAELVKNRLAYAFRPPVALNRLHYDGTTVTLTTTKRAVLKLTPLDFLAKITLHIPNRYQNIRRYAGFYSPNIQSKVRRARLVDRAKKEPIEESKPVAPKWAAMIALIFGEIPITCPKCGTIMDLKEFVFDDAIIQKFFPWIPRAPPKIVISADIPDDGIRYIRSDDGTAYDDICQPCPEYIEGLRPETDEDFDQSTNW